MKSRVYINAIIMPVNFPLSQELGVNFILMVNNARPHRARTVEQIFEEWQVIVYHGRPTIQTKILSIENLWNHLSRAVQRRINPPGN